MTTAGPPDDPPGEESEGIRYFDFSESFEPAEPDPFESEDPAAPEASKERAPSRFTLVRGGREEQTSGAASTRDAFESALEDLPSHASPDASADSPAATFAPLTAFVGRKGGDTRQRARFVSTFNAARIQGQQPFVAVALRMPPDDPASSQFPLVEQGLRSALRSDDAVLVDRERFRLAAVLPGRGHDDVRPVLAALMAYLREHTDDAAEIGHCIAVFTAPDGHPFHDGAGFLAEAFDKP